ncbi:hypothetical protein [Lentzea tibetensis]|nr:hypothetical protein [Lentzea tibetensis]
MTVPPVVLDNSDALFQGGYTKEQMAQALRDTIQRISPNRHGTWAA